MSILRSGNCRGLELRKYFWPFLLGFLATAFQIVILREFEVRFHSNELVYGLVLSFWLLGGGIGSWLGEKKHIKNLTPATSYTMVILIAAVVLLYLRFSRFLQATLPAETTGPGPLLLAALLIALLLSLPLGALFVFNVFWKEGDLLTVYQLESLGSAAGCLSVYLILAPNFSSWQAAALIMLLVGAGISLSLKKKMIYLGLFLALSAVFWFGDEPAEKIYWKPYSLAEFRDSPYSRIQIIRQQEHISFYANSSILFNFPDPAAAEEAVHFALLQRPEAREVLIIGGGLNGSIAQALKYANLRVDYVELDPVLVRLARSTLPLELIRINDPRVTVHLTDGRRFLKQAGKTYEVIICNPGEPATARANRFYTFEFFELVRKKLSPGGVFSFLLPSSENYLSPQRSLLLASIYSSLKSVFPRVEVVPGENNVFLASDGPVDISVESLTEMINRYRLETIFFRPELLKSRLHPLKREYLKSSLEITPAPPVNSDRHPISYFYQILLWSQQFQENPARWLASFTRLDRRWLFDLPLIIFLTVLAIMFLRRRKSPGVFLLPVMLMGFTTIVAEIALILDFQSQQGLIYSQLSLLFAMFMAGLFIGSTLARRLPSFSRLKQLLAVQAGFIVLLAAPLLFQASASSLFYFVFLLVLGCLGGMLFVIGNYLYLLHKKRYGLGYAFDLFGSFSGALLAATLFIPHLGLNMLYTFLLLLNSMCLIFIFMRVSCMK